jgi:hypothetical protein
MRTSLHAWMPQVSICGLLRALHAACVQSGIRPTTPTFHTRSGTRLHRPGGAGVGAGDGDSASSANLLTPSTALSSKAGGSHGVLLVRGGATTCSSASATPQGNSTSDGLTASSAAAHTTTVSTGGYVGGGCDGLTASSAAPQATTVLTSSGGGYGGAYGGSVTHGVAPPRNADGIGATMRAEEHTQAPIRERTARLVRRVEDALDDMGAQGQLLAGRYVILGPLERRSGGQGVVQFVRGAQDEHNHAAKVRSSATRVLASDPHLRAWQRQRRHPFVPCSSTRTATPSTSSCSSTPTPHSSRSCPRPTRCLPTTMAPSARQGASACHRASCSSAARALTSSRAMSTLRSSPSCRRAVPWALCR